ncbi:MAG: sodium/solute symporter [Spirochaetes bacterium]|nr:sodium/solute symporter [Spirochaetota bacterium]
MNTFSFSAFFKFVPTEVHWFDISLIFIYLIGISIFGYFFHRRIKNSSDYFLAGKTLPWWIIGMSIIGTNIGSNDYVGGAGGAFRYGIAQANFEWIGAIPAMVISAIVFIPFYWRAGVFSIPEYLGRRYNQAVRVISATVLSLFSVLIVGVFLWSTALMLNTYLGWPIAFSIVITAGVVGLYTISGGLEAVAYTDAVQMVIMFIGAIAMAILGFHAVGGIGNFVEQIQLRFPQHFQAFLPSTHEEFPWPGVLLGLGLVLSPAYWCANQAILQRCLGARSEWDGKASMIFAALAKMFVPFLIVLPGFFALLLASDKLHHADQALPWVVKNILPVGVSGIFFVAFVAALQSSISSTMNSTAVMVTRDIIGVMAAGKLVSEKELALGRWITFAVLICGVFCAPLTALYRGIYVFVQQLLSFFQGPVFALVLLGILSKRVTSVAGLWALICGLAFAIFLGAMKVNMLYIAFWSFVFSVLLLIAISRFTKAKSDGELSNLTYSTTVRRE